MSDTPPFLPTDIALPYGLGPEGKLVSIDAVVSGLACGCVCPGCGRPLIARKGPVIRHHFGHATRESCGTGFESMLHLLAKDIIAKELTVAVPEIVVVVGKTRRRIRGPSILALSNVRLEQWLQGIRPDIIADVGGHQLIIEIAVTHKAEPEKLAELERRGAPAIEIDLSEFHRKEITEAALRDAIIRSSPRLWLFNRLAHQALPEVTSIEDARFEAEHQVELQIAQERATLAEEWARWVEQETVRLAKVEAARREQEIRDAASFDQSKTKITQEASLFLGAEAAVEWVERLVSYHVSREGKPSGSDHDARFETWARDQLVRKSSAIVATKAANQTTRDAVLRAAIAKFGSREKADLWMTTVNPKIGRRRPIDVCSELNGLDLCKAAL